VALLRATGPAKAKEAVRIARNAATVKGAISERLSTTRPCKGVELQAQERIVEWGWKIDGIREK
jgi:hypothetical protein